MFEFCQKLFNSIFDSILLTQNSIQTIIQFKINSSDSIQKKTQLNSQRIIDTGKIRKVAKRVSKIDKRGLLIKIQNIDSIHDSFIHFRINSIQKNIQNHFFFEYSIKKIIIQQLFFQKIQFKI